MLDILEFFGFLIDIFTSWRFFLVLIATALLIALIFSGIKNETIALALAIPVGIFGLEEDNCFK